MRPSVNRIDLQTMDVHRDQSNQALTNPFTNLPTMISRTIWLLSLGFFFGSVLSRMTASYWTTSIAAVGMIIGTLGTVIRREQAALTIKDEANIGAGDCK